MMERKPTENQIKFAKAISNALDVHPEEETFEAYDDFISYYRKDFYECKREGRYY